MCVSIFYISLFLCEASCDIHGGALAKMMFFDMVSESDDGLTHDGNLTSRIRLMERQEDVLLLVRMLISMDEALGNGRQWLKAI